MKKNSGFLIIEVLLAIVILSTITLSFYSIIRTTQIKTQKTDFESDMAVVAQNGMEISENNLRNNWDMLPPGNYTPAFDSGNNEWLLIPTVNPETNIETRYTRTISILNVCRDSRTGQIIDQSPCRETEDDNSKIVRVTVGWVNPSFGKPLSTDLLVLKPN